METKRIALNIKGVRTMRELSREEVAEALNMAVAVYGRLERAETTISLEQLYQIAEKLRVPVAFLQYFDIDAPDAYKYVYNSNIDSNNNNSDNGTFTINAISDKVLDVFNTISKNEDLLREQLQKKDEQIAFLQSLLMK